MDVGFSWLEPDTPKIQSCSLKSQQDNPALLGGYQLETKGCLPFLLPFTDLSFSHFLFSLRDILLLTVVKRKHYELCWSLSHPTQIFISKLSIIRQEFYLFIYFLTGLWCRKFG